jgi:hypothetical protein
MTRMKPAIIVLAFLILPGCKTSYLQYSSEAEITKDWAMPGFATRNSL